MPGAAARPRGPSARRSDEHHSADGIEHAIHEVEREQSVGAPMCPRRVADRRQPRRCERVGCTRLRRVRATAVRERVPGRTCSSQRGPGLRGASARRSRGARAPVGTEGAGRAGPSRPAAVPTSPEGNSSIRDPARNRSSPRCEGYLTAVPRCFLRCRSACVSYSRHDRFVTLLMRKVRSTRSRRRRSSSAGAGFGLGHRPIPGARTGSPDWSGTCTRDHGNRRAGQ